MVGFGEGNTIGEKKKNYATWGTDHPVIREPAYQAMVEKMLFLNR